MHEKNIIQKILTPLTDHARVETVFGQPQILSGKIVVPVARVFLMFGGGLGSGQDQNNEPAEGGGGGFMLSAQPIGALEITEEKTTLVKFRSWWHKLLPLGLGFLIGAFVLKLMDQDKK